MKWLTWLPLVVLAACAADESSSTSSLTQPPGQCGEIETHVFGVYRAPGGQAKVHIDRPGHHVVVVSAHDATTWTVTAGPEAVIDAVYAVGIEPQTVRGPDGAQIKADSQADGGPYACGFAYPASAADGCDTQQLLNLAGKITRHDATSFHGCQVASSFSVGEDMAVRSNCDLPLSEYAACLGPDSCGGPVIL